MLFENKSNITLEGNGTLLVYHSKGECKVDCVNRNLEFTPVFKYNYKLMEYQSPI